MIQADARRSSRAARRRPRAPHGDRRAEVADETALVARRTEPRRRSATRGPVPRTVLEEQAATAAPELAAAQDRWGRAAVAARSPSNRPARWLASGSGCWPRTTWTRPRPGVTPDELRAQAAQAREAEAALATEVATTAQALSEAVAAPRRCRRGVCRRAARRLAIAGRAAADRREGLGRLAGQVAARRSRIEAREAERTRLGETIATSLQRAAKADEDFAALETTVADDDAGEAGLDSTYEAGRGPGWPKPPPPSRTCAPANATPARPPRPPRPGSTPLK